LSNLRLKSHQLKISCLCLQTLTYPENVNILVYLQDWTKTLSDCVYWKKIFSIYISAKHTSFTYSHKLDADM